MLTLLSGYMMCQTIVTLALANNCNNISTTVQTVKNDQSKLDVFPNPTNGTFKLNVNFQTTINKAIISIFDAKGNIVYSDEIFCNSPRLVKSMNLPILRAGTYILSVKNTETEATTKLMIKP